MPCLRRWEQALDLALVGIDLEVQPGIHMEETAPEDEWENLVLAEDTSLVVRHKAFQGIQDQVDHHDPIDQEEEDRKADSQDLERMEVRQEVGDLVEGREDLAAGCDYFDEVDLDFDSVEDEIRSVGIVRKDFS